MASERELNPSALGISADERDRQEREERRRLEELANRITRRWDPSALSRVSVAEAGQVEKLDDATRHRMERRIGGRFSDVRVVRGAFADRITRHHRADAVTVGRTGLILVRDTPRGNFKTSQGQALLAHELTHVRQAQRGMHFAHEHGRGQSALEAEATAVEQSHDDQKQRVHDARQSLEELGRLLFEAAVKATTDALATHGSSLAERNGSNDEG